MKCKYTLVFNRTGKLNKDGKSVIQIRVYQPDGAGGKQIHLKTGVHVFPKQWNKNKQRIINHPNEINLNAQLKQQIADLEKFELQTINAGKDFNIKMFKDFLKGKYTNSFTKFCKLEMEDMKKTYKISTWKTCNASLNKFMLFSDNIQFNEINYSLIQKFDRFLQQRKLHQNSIHRIHKQIKYFINLACKKGYFDINKNPYNHFKLKQVSSRRDYLKPDEIEKIEKTQFPEEYQYLNKVRDYFLFMLYTGLRYKDFNNLQKKHIKQETNGDYYIELKPEKTADSSGKIVYIPLKFNNKPIEILERYKKEFTNFIFNDLKPDFINRELKKIAELCQIKKKITCHVARHSLATFLIYKGVPLSTIKEILGHSSVKTTEIYAKIMNDTVKNDLNKIDFTNY